MIRQGIFALISAALVGGLAVVYASLSETPFFPASLQAAFGVCPENKYFPAHRRPILKPEEASWFGSQLLALHEAPLSREIGAGKLAVRVFILSDRSNAVVRVHEAADGRFHLQAKWLSPCAEERGCVVEKVLTPEEWARVKTAIEPLLVVPSYGCDGPADSSSVVMELSDANTYRLWFNRTLPSGDLGSASVLLFQLADWQLAEDYRASVMRR
ncbi:hypothetical protein [Brevundimonas sp.]|uniref:hypothetical protein n=1 Tax=Brevundimonas sp. TaxID=1871086 RepID=UPI001AD25B20|nr:hypothetical protein [Brevundimonas sp.]MBN9465123.1 hypothetical protein [Brevundimonas sp.]